MNLNSGLLILKNTQNIRDVITFRILVSWPALDAKRTKFIKTQSH